MRVHSEDTSTRMTTCLILVHSEDTSTRMTTCLILVHSEDTSARRTTCLSVSLTAVDYAGSYKSFKLFSSNTIFSKFESFHAIIFLM